MKRRLPVLIGASLVTLSILSALLAPLLAPHDPAQQQLERRLEPPSAEHPLGLDELGRDIFSRLVYGARVSLVVGVTVALVSVAIGLFIGLMAGYFRLADAIIMRVMDGLMAIPAILLAIALVSLSGASLFTVIMAMIAGAVAALKASVIDPVRCLRYE